MEDQLHRPPPTGTSGGGLRFSLRHLFLAATTVVALFGIWSALITPARRAAQRTAWKDFIYPIRLALANYGTAHDGQLPPAVLRKANPGDDPQGLSRPGNKALSSWRFLIAAYLESTGMGVHLNQSWQSPANAGWAKRPQPSYCGGRNFTDASASARDTEIFAITGPGTAWGDGVTEPPHVLSKLPGDTILIAEVRNSGVHWMEPGDFDIRTMPRTLNAPDGKGISSRFTEGFHVGFADGEVWFLSNEVGFERLAKFFTIDGASAHDRERELAPFRLQ